MDCLDESLGLSGRDDVLECLVHVVEETNHLIRYCQFLPLEVQSNNINLQCQRRLLVVKRRSVCLKFIMAFDV